MSGILMMVIAIVVLGGAYLLYGRYLQKKWGIDPNAKTPAYEMEDGVDYVPADTNAPELRAGCGFQDRQWPCPWPLHFPGPPAGERAHHRASSAGQNSPAPF